MIRAGNKPGQPRRSPLTSPFREKSARETAMLIPVIQIGTARLNRQNPIMTARQNPASSKLENNIIGMIRKQAWTASSPWDSGGERDHPEKRYRAPRAFGLCRVSGSKTLLSGQSLAQFRLVLPASWSSRMRNRFVKTSHDAWSNPHPIRA